MAYKRPKTAQNGPKAIQNALNYTRPAMVIDTQYIIDNQIPTNGACARADLLAAAALMHSGSSDAKPPPSISRARVADLGSADLSSR